MARDALAEFVVREARRIVEPSQAELLGVEDGVARVRFKPVHDPRCETCVTSPDDFRAFLLELFAQRAPHVSDVSVELVE